MQLDKAIIKLRVREVKVGEIFYNDDLQNNLFDSILEEMPPEHEPYKMVSGEVIESEKRYLVQENFYYCSVISSMGDNVGDYNDNCYNYERIEGGLSDFWKESKEQIINDYKLYGSELYYIFSVEYGSSYDYFHGCDEGYADIMPLELIDFNINKFDKPKTKLEIEEENKKLNKNFFGILKND